MVKNNSRMYYAVDLSLYHAEPLFDIELDFFETRITIDLGLKSH